MKSNAKWYCRERSRGERAFMQKYMELYRSSGIKMSEATKKQQHEWENEAREYAVQLEPRIERVEYIDDYTLLVYQDEGVSRMITLRPFIDLETSPLANLDYFRQVQVLNDRTGIVWPDGTTIFNFLLDSYDVKWFTEE